MSRLLEVRDLSVAYGKIEAVRNVTLEVEKGADRHHHRAERRRKDDDAGGADGHFCPRAAPSSMKVAT